MIARIRLERWRAYETLDLTLNRAVTFFVAPNGVGKTSLVEAVRWGLFGKPAPRRLGQAVRIGHDTATVQLDLLVDDCAVQVTRTLHRGGGVRFAATADGDPIDEARYNRLLQRVWGADPGLLEALIFGAETKGEATAFPIKDHLADIFGVTPLLQAAHSIKIRRTELAAKIRSLRNDLSGSDEAIVAATAAVARLERELAAVAEERSAAEDAAARLEQAAELARGWAEYRLAAHAYDEKVRELVMRMTGTMQAVDADLAEAIAADEREAFTQLESNLAAKTAAEIQAARAASGVELLADSTGHCPTCLRPLEPAERDHALRAHGGADHAAHAQIDQHDRETARARERLTAISRFRDALSALRAPVEPDGPDPGSQAIDELDGARRLTSGLAERNGQVTAQLEAARAELSRLQRAEADQSRLTETARQDSVMEVTERTIHTLADRYLTNYIEPIAREVGHRWKLVFGADGLHFDADGNLSVARGEASLAMGDLSGGERSTALIVTRLLLANTLARASSVWFDEPLEHLDPRRRTAIAQTLVSAVQAGTVGQILVTTYEENLARRLAAVAPDTVGLTYATTDSS
ncbi:AAA family ATPase [Streptomyces sp. HPF1205]|uniref:AAA family ATPase n=1 Tax=Streptomyces sp. HPF1205 TaxID=2873262 RepID=UPI001CEDF56C|nr:AAA family ATPase [Streptomyces sp. HPF1205]